MPTVNVNGITINYSLEKIDSTTDSAQGDLIVLVNGLADDLETWDYQVPALLKHGYRVLRYDNRGIGKSSKPPGPYTAEMMADDLNGLLGNLKVGPFHLVGVSMGGMIVQAYALKYPNGTNETKMLSLSLVCTYAEPSTFCSRMFELWADMARRMSVQDVMRDVTLWAFTVPFFRSRRSDLEAVEDVMRKLDMPLDAYLSQLNVIQQFDTTGSLDGLTASEQCIGGLEPKKVLVLAGKVDILIPLQLSRELAERIVGCQFLTTKGGHACLWEFPDEFNKTLLAFLDENKTS